ncbi:MAG: DNA-3-methyladenine glycosylase family protein [Thermoleophilaceae bacterium]
MSAHTGLAGSDPVMAGLVSELGRLSFETRLRGRPRPDSYGMLLRSIVGQQVSAKAAAKIHDRVLELFGGRAPTPAELLAVEPGQLRGAGLSGRKVEYVRDLARQIESGELELERLAELSDEEVIAEISAVRGLGVWSAQMFLMFALERPDVLPTGDLGIRRAVQVAYGLDELPGHDELTRIAEPWRPHRTLACIYLWETRHNTPA